MKKYVLVTGSIPLNNKSEGPRIINPNSEANLFKIESRTSPNDSLYLFGKKIARSVIATTNISKALKQRKIPAPYANIDPRTPTIKYSKP